MSNVFKRAQHKRLNHKQNSTEDVICEKSRQHSEQLMLRFDEVINHLSEEEDVDACKRKLQELHRHHHRCFGDKHVSGPNER